MTTDPPEPSVWFPPECLGGPDEDRANRALATRLVEPVAPWSVATCRRCGAVSTCQGDPPWCGVCREDRLWSAHNRLLCDAIHGTAPGRRA